MTTSHTPDAVLDELRSAQRFILTGHINPDGDSIGSALALARILRGLGKRAVVWNRDEMPKVFRSLPGADRAHVGLEPPDGFPEAFDVAITCECPSLERTGLGEELEKLDIVNIDHHLGNTHYGKVNWIDTAAPALGEMIHRLAGDLKVPLDEDLASLLYVTIETDTGGFRFSNATESAFLAAAALVREGAQPAKVSSWIYESQPEASIRLLGEMLQGLDITDGGRIACVALTREMFEKTGADSSDTEGLVDYPRSIAGVDLVLLMRQTGENEYKVSLRSKGEHNVEKIARTYGGGGHHNAAGFQVEGEFKKLKNELLEELRAIL